MLLHERREAVISLQTVEAYMYSTVHAVKIYLVYPHNSLLMMKVGIWQCIQHYLFAFSV